MKCSKFSWGIVAGITLGILFAPRKGEETRQKLRNSCKGCQNKLEEWFGDANEEINELKLLLANAEEDLNDDARHKLMKILEKVGKNKKFFDGEVS